MAGNVHAEALLFGARVLIRQALEFRGGGVLLEEPDRDMVTACDAIDRARKMLREKLGNDSLGGR